MGAGSEIHVAPSKEADPAMADQVDTNGGGVERRDALWKSARPDERTGKRRMAPRPFEHGALE